MDVIKSGLEAIRGGVDCPCICSRGAGWSGNDTVALNGGGCACGCACRNIDTYANNVANQTAAWDMLY